MYDKVGEATALVSSIREMLNVSLLDIKSVRLVQRLDILEMYLKKLPEVVNESYDEVREGILVLLSTSMESSRTIKMQKVQDALKDRNVFDMCISELQHKGILATPYKIGQGGFGQVYKGIIAGVPTVLKLVGDEYLPSQDALPPGSTTLPRDFQPKEYKLGLILNDLVLSDQCPNFMLAYDIGICNRYSTREVIYFMEEANFDLAQAFQQKFFGPTSQVSLLAQLLIALHYMHTRLDVVHRDIKSQNILLIKTPSLARTLMTYEVDERTFVLENTGVIPCLADFGVTGVLDTYDSNRDLKDLLGTFIGGTVQSSNSSYIHKGYPDLLPTYKSAFSQARDREYPPLDTLQFILDRINYKPTEDLPISKVYKSTPLKTDVPADDALVGAVLEGDDERIEFLFSLAKPQYQDLAMVAAVTQNNMGDAEFIEFNSDHENSDLLATAMIALSEDPLKTKEDMLSYTQGKIESKILIPLLMVFNLIPGAVDGLRSLVAVDEEEVGFEFSRLLVASALGGSVAAIELLLSKSPNANLDRAFQAAELVGNADVAEFLSSKGAEEGRNLPTFPPSTFRLFESLQTLREDYGVRNERVDDLIDGWSQACEILQEA
jgi:serine/threonine protein kinase